MAGSRNHDRADCAQAAEDFSRLGEPSHMGITGSEVAIRYWKARIVLDRKEELRHGLIKAPRQEMGRPNTVSEVPTLAPGLSRSAVSTCSIARSG